MNIKYISSDMGIQFNSISRCMFHISGESINTFGSKKSFTIKQINSRALNITRT